MASLADDDGLGIHKWPVAYTGVLVATIGFACKGKYV
jgi:hypothetical protein